MLINSIAHFLPENPFMNSLAILGILSIISTLAYWITEKIIIRLLTKMFKKTSTHLDDILVNRNVFSRLAYIIPALIFYNFSTMIPHLTFIIQRASLCLMAIASLLVLNSFLNALGDIYQQTKFSKRLHIKSYLQITKLILNILGYIVIIAILVGKNPTWLLSGLGAMTAVILLIFKDTILSLVASLQISSNDLFKVGDWIEAPQFGADGDVVDIALHTVKIQNWDKTYSIIPTFKLVDSTFKNWRGMSESGGRRIKRAINIDMNSISFCGPDKLEKFSKFEFLKEYITNKKVEVQEYNDLKNIDTSELINGRRLTNIGTFRAYIEAYLENNKDIHRDMTFLIRQLRPTDKGLPIEIYVFTNNIDWIQYEKIQADIFDHLLAVIPEFGLKVFQNPSGKDLENLNK